MDLFLVVALALALLTNLVQAFWRGCDDSSWELRYRSLDDLDQAWIGAASRTSTSRPALEERDEVELAKGIRRREARRRARVGLWAAPVLVAATVLFVAGLVPLVIFSTVAGAYGIAPASWTSDAVARSKPDTARSRTGTWRSREPDQPLRSREPVAWIST